MLKPKRQITYADTLDPESTFKLLKLPFDSGDKYWIKHAALLELVYGTGLRASEVSNLRLGDIDWDDESLKVTRKGGRLDLVYMPKGTVIAMKRYHANRDSQNNNYGNSNEYFFPGRNGGINQKQLHRIRHQG